MDKDTIGILSLSIIAILLSLYMVYWYNKTPELVENRNILGKMYNEKE